MTDTPSAILLLRLMSVGSSVNLWGGYLNTALQTLERASKGYQTLAVTGSATISWTNYSAANDGAVAFLNLTGSLSSAVALTFPGYQHYVSVKNATGQAVTIKCSGGTGVTIPNGARTLLFCDGTDYYSATPNWQNTPSSLLNNGDIPTYAQLVAYVAAAVTAASTAVSGLMSRYVYTAAGGETSKSGADDSGNVLAYTPGSEIVTVNGVQLVRNVDYTASNGTTISGLTALSANDELTVIALGAVSVPSCFSISNNLSEGTPATMRSNLGLGTAALKNTGTSGSNVPLLDGENTWSATQTFAGSTFGGAAPSGAGITALFASPPAIGGTAAAAGTFTTVGGTTITASTQVTTPKIVSASGVVQVAPSNSRMEIANSSGPTLTFNASGLGTDHKIWDIKQDGRLAIRAVNDAYNSATEAYAIASDATFGIASHIWNTSATAGTPVQTMKLTMASNKTNLTITPPTSSAGLATGTLYSNAGVATFA